METRYAIFRLTKAKDFDQRFNKVGQPDKYFMPFAYNSEGKWKPTNEQLRHALQIQKISMLEGGFTKKGEKHLKHYEATCLVLNDFDGYDIRLVDSGLSKVMAKLVIEQKMEEA